MSGEVGRLALPGEEVDEGWRALGPSEGWASVAILLFMLLTVGWALDDAGWAGRAADGSSATGFLPTAIVLGALFGLAGAKSRLATWQIHLLGALAATAYLIYTVCSVLSTASSLQARLDTLNASVAQFYYDLVVLQIRSPEISVFLLAIGSIAWATGQFAAVVLFRRHRPLSAVLVPGLVMLLEVCVTLKSQYLLLIFFWAAALLLLVRFNLLEQRAGWHERRIGDANAVSQLFMRSGAVFVTLTLMGSLFLAATASSAPLAGAFRNAGDDFVVWGSDLNRLVGGVTGAARGPGGLFTSAQTIRGVWEASDAVAFTFTSSDGRGYYWRAATYDTFDGTTWQQLDRTAAGRVEPGRPLLAATTDAVEEGERRRRVDFSVTAADLGGRVLLAPETPVAIDRATEVYTNAPGGPFAIAQLVDSLEAGDTYSVSALVPTDAEGGATANQLAAAGRQYPDWAERFVAIRPGSIGQLTEDTADRIVTGLPRGQRDPYHIALAVQRFLYRDGGFTYRTDVRGQCGNEKLVDCFLRTRVGYCEYFATAMVMLLRTQQVPARIAMGYLPGRQKAKGEWEVSRAAAHAWVEVYFPSYGWIRFDPTPGNRENGQTPTRIDPGPPDASEAPEDSARPDESARFGDPRRALERGERDQRDNGRDPLGAGSTDDGAGGPLSGTGLLLTGVLLALLLLAGLLVLLVRARRAPAPQPDIAYRGMARLAGRFGYGPRPQQTAYEYAGTLSALVPAVRTELHVVAQAKVEATYAGRAPAEDALAALRRAYRRVRVGLLRLALRRVPRPGLGRGRGPRLIRRAR